MIENLLPLKKDCHTINLIKLLSAIVQENTILFALYVPYLSKDIGAGQKE